MVRKRGTRPIGPDDGERVATLEGVRYDDVSPESGVDFHYAVFADRRGAASRDGAHAEAPLIVLGDVQHLRAHIGDSEVRLDWAPPANVHRVFAVRTPAPRDGTGSQLYSIDTRQLVDRAVVNDEEYRYTVRCEFVRSDGQTVLSAGASVVATPQQRPATVEPFTITPVDVAADRALQLRWQPPPKGDVWILNSPERPLCVEQAIPARELSRYGETTVASGASMIARWQGGGVRYYTPVVVLGETAYVGSASRYTHVDDVTELNAQNLGDRVRLSWTWPVGCSAVCVNVSGFGWPLDDQNNLPTDATRIQLGRAEYDRHGSYDIRPSGDGDVYVIVQAVDRLGGENVFAQGARCRVRLQSRVRLEYELHPPGLLRRAPELAIRVDRATVLPPFRIVRKRGRLPQNRDDGECVLRSDGTASAAGSLRVRLVDTRPDGHAFGKLFLDSDQDYEWITVLHPDRSKLKL